MQGYWIQTPRADQFGRPGCYWCTGTWCATYLESEQVIRDLSQDPEIGYARIVSEHAEEVLATAAAGKVTTLCVPYPAGIADQV